MNIPENFDLYYENRLPEGEKTKFEKELVEQPGLAESYNAYFQINRILKEELYSPILSHDDDLILKDLTILQRLEIEDDFYRFSTSEPLALESLDSNFNSDSVTFQGTAKTITSHKTVEELKIHENRFLNLLKKNHENKTSGKTKILLPFIGIAAALVLSFFAGKIIFGLNFAGLRQITSQEAYYIYYNPQSDKELSSLNFVDSRSGSAFPDYKRSTGSEVSLFSDHVQVSYPDYELSLLFLVLINMEKKDFPGARKCFEKGLSLVNPGMKNSMNYYLSLAYLSEGNFSLAEPILLKLSQNKNPYQKKSKAILRSVKHP
jgi:hypothetical protein